MLRFSRPLLSPFFDDHELLLNYSVLDIWAHLRIGRKSFVTMLNREPWMTSGNVWWSDPRRESCGRAPKAPSGQTGEAPAFLA